MNLPTMGVDFAREDATDASMNDREFLAWLVERAEQFRSRPFGGVDFEVDRDRFYDAVKTAKMRLKNASNRPTIVCLCGSTRFMAAFRKANLEETLAGRIVLTVGCDTKSDTSLGLATETKVALDKLHKEKIRWADEILVLNVGGYIGFSTRSEIEFAEQLGRRIRYLETPKGEA